MRPLLDVRALLPDEPRHRQTNATGRRSQLHWRAEWGGPSRRPVHIGLLDTPVDTAHPDLVGADVEVRSFTDASSAAAGSHGTFSLSLLVGQGRRLIRGLVPTAAVSVGVVFDHDDIASSEAICAGLDWLLHEGVAIIVLPLGTPTVYPDITRRVRIASRRAIPVVAAAGNDSAGRPIFPACLRQVVGITSNSVAAPSASDPIHVMAPCNDIPGPVSRQRLGKRSGTSIGSVLAAGALAAALITDDEKDVRTRSRVVSLLTGM